MSEISKVSAWVWVRLTIERDGVKGYVAIFCEKEFSDLPRVIWFRELEWLMVFLWMDFSVSLSLIYVSNEISLKYFDNFPRTVQVYLSSLTCANIYEQCIRDLKLTEESPTLDISFSKLAR